MAKAYTRFELCDFSDYGCRPLSQGVVPGSESSVIKLSYSQHTAALTDLALLLEGSAGMLGTEAAPDGGYWQQLFLSQWSSYRRWD